MTAKIYQKKPVPVEAIQVNPHGKAGDIEKFCPSVRFLGGLHFNQTDEPTGDSPFFSVLSREGRVYGELYDWIIKGDGGLYWINANEYFEKNYEEVK